MKTGRLLILFVVCTLCSCEKPAVDYRDKFEGVYEGNIRYSFQATSPNSTSRYDTCYENQYAYVVKATDDSSVCIAFRPCTTQVRVGDNGTFRYGGSKWSRYQGIGRIVGDSLFCNHNAGSMGAFISWRLSSCKVNENVPDSIRQVIINNARIVEKDPYVY